MLLVAVAAAVVLVVPSGSLPPRVQQLSSARSSRRTIVRLANLKEQNIPTACLLLPYSPHGGNPHIDVVGEVMLQELEDDEETRTQLFFNADGTVSHGATDGPPPAGFCGLWQCGAEKFQMTIQRSFSSAPKAQDASQIGAMKEDIVYTTTRQYEGVVEETSTGVGLVQGRIDLFDEAEAEWALNNKALAESLANVRTPAIGYFIIDAGASIEEMEVEA